MSDSTYAESFFHIDLDITSKNIDHDFYHEYIHYLQNLLSISGLNYTFNFFNIGFDAIIEIRKNKKIKRLPFKFDCNKNETITNYLNIVNAEINENIIFNQIVDLFQYGYNTQLEPIYRVKTDTGYIIELTRNHIIEGMAYLCELYNFPIPTFRNDNPYSVISRLIDYFLPNFSNNDLFKIAICEYSLNSTNPVPLLIEILELLKNQQQPTNSLNDLVVLLATNFNTALSPDGKPISFLKVYIQQLIAIRKQLRVHFNSHYMPYIINWVRTITLNAFNEFNANKIPITTIVQKIYNNKTKIQCTIFQNNATFYNIITKLGCPVITPISIFNKFPQIFLFNIPDLRYLCAMESIYNQILNEKSKCPFSDYCPYKEIYKKKTCTSYRPWLLLKNRYFFKNPHFIRKPYPANNKIIPRCPYLSIWEILKLYKHPYLKNK